MTSDRPAIFLHIGAMKTGTTFVQQKLIANKAALARAGFLFPGDSWSRQVRAVQEVLHLYRGDPRIREEARGAWQAIADEMLAHRGTSILSMEFLSFAGRARARRVVHSLAGADVDVVLTVRDTLATIPAQWQTSVHNGASVSWPDFLRGVQRASGLRASWGRYLPDPPLRSFLQAVDVPRMLAVWGRVVPSERLHVVTVPPLGSDPDLLWRRVAGVLRLDPGVCSEPPAESNTSLGFGSSELLRRVNQRLGRQRTTDYNGTVKGYLALQVLAGRRSQESRAQLDAASREFALAWNRRIRAAVTASGARLVGDLEDLPTSTTGAASGFRPAPEEQEVLEAAAVAVAAMDRLVRRRSRRLRRVGAELPKPSRDPFTASIDRWAGAPDPVEAAADEIAGLCLTAIEHHRRLRSDSL